MIVAPCSVRTMSEIATGVTSSLLTRAADVTLKERRPLVLMVRETPLHLGHLRTMVKLAEMGAVIAPPLPAFYARPRDSGGDGRPVGGPRARPVRPVLGRGQALVGSLRAGATRRMSLWSWSVAAWESADARQALLDAFRTTQASAYRCCCGAPGAP